MILSAFIGPILEELIFRWFIFSSINKSLIIKVIVSSVLFGLMHFIPSIGAISLNELLSASNTICISRNCVLSGLYKKRKCCFWDSSSYEHQFDA